MNDANRRALASADFIRGNKAKAGRRRETRPVWHQKPFEKDVMEIPERGE
jgi:hypothetical protein